MTAWPMWEVTVDGRASALAAPSRGAAIYQRFLDWADVSDITFRRFLDLARARRIAPALAGDPYGHVRSYYGRDIRHGSRVTITGEGKDLEGRAGTVVHPGKDSTQYAHVVLDGDTYAGIYHPLSVVLS